MSHAVDADGSYSTEISAAEMTEAGIRRLITDYAAMVSACTTEEKRAALGSAHGNGDTSTIEARHHGALQFYARELTTRATALADRLETAILAAQERGYRKGYAAAREDASDASDASDHA